MYIEWNNSIHFLIDGIVTISLLILVNYEFIFHAVLLFESFHYIGRL